jgi:hypothetical protein
LPLFKPPKQEVTRRHTSHVTRHTSHVTHPASCAFNPSCRTWGLSPRGRS